MPSPSAAALQIWGAHNLGGARVLPFYSTPVPAGFPSPAEDHQGDALSLDDLLISRPAATFFVRVDGDSLLEANICDEDILVVDRSITPVHGHIVVVLVDGGLTVKILEQTSDRVRLLPANRAYAPIELIDGQELEVWGVVTGVVRPGLAHGVGHVRTG